MQNTTQYPKQRNLDTTVFKVLRPSGDSGYYKDICFSDLTEKEMKQVLSQYDAKSLVKLCIILGKTIHHMGDKLKVCGRTQFEANIKG